MATHKIEKELTALTKIARKPDEDEQDFFKRLHTKVDGLPEDVWGKMSEPAQEWSNAAGIACDEDQQIPNFDGEIPTADETASADDGDGGEETAEAGEEASEEEPVATRKSKKTAAKKGAAVTKKTQIKEEKAAAKEGRIPTKKTSANSVKKEAPAKKAADGAKRGRKGEFNEDSKITKVAKENPFREGSKAAECYAEYKVGRTVKDVLSKGVPRSKLARHAKKGVVTIG